MNNAPAKHYLVPGVIGVISIAAMVFAASAGAQTPTPSRPVGTIPVPVQPLYDTPLRPLQPSPAGPSPANPILNRPPVFSVGPTAEQDSVQNRSRPEYDPPGIVLDQLLSRIGLVDTESARASRSGLASFLVFPRFDIQTRYESNLLKEENATSDQVFDFQPAVIVRSDWASHGLEFEGSANIGRHVSTSSEDYEDVRARLGGFLELLDNIKLTASFESGRSHQQRGSLLDPGGAFGATIFTVNKVAFGGEYRLDPLTVSVNFQAEGLDYDDNGLSDNDDLDHVARELTLRASLEVDEGTSVFIQPKFNWRSFDRAIDVAGFRQDNDGFEVLSGLRWDASGVTFAEFGVGYLQQSFDDSRFATISGPTASAKAIWNATDILTVTVGLTRKVLETSDTEYSGVLETRFAMEVDYEYFYNTIFSAQFAYVDEDYRSSTRSDSRFKSGAGVRHLFNENIFVEVSLSYENLDSTLAATDFSAFTTLFRLGTRL